MQGKFDSSHWRSTSLVRLATRCVPGPFRAYFLTVSSTVAVAPLTSTACVLGLPSSLQVFNVYFPAGIFLISKLPSLSVTAKYGVGTTTTYPDISGCTLQRREAVPRSLNWNGFLSPFGQVPRLWESFLLPLIDGQYTLWPTGSLFKKSTVVPCCTATTRGMNAIFRWSTTMWSFDGSNFLSAITST